MWHSAMAMTLDTRMVPVETYADYTALHNTILQAKYRGEIDEVDYRNLKSKLDRENQDVIMLAWYLPWNWFTWGVRKLRG